MASYAFGGANYFRAYAEDGSFGMDPAYSYGGLKAWASRGELRPDFPQADHFLTEMDAFSAAILDNRPFAPSGEEGLRDLLVIEAIYQSIREGKPVAPAKA